MKWKVFLLVGSSQSHIKKEDGLKKKKEFLLWLSGNEADWYP